MVDTATVVLVDDDGTPTGSARKDAIHGLDTPLHLAFSCYLFDPSGRVLVTRRALAKKTWPGVWTNSFCGHPTWDEPMPAAIERHAAGELGVQVSGIRELLPDFRYRAVDAGGIVENEVCPVFAAFTNEDIHPNAAEVAEWAWVDPRDLFAAIRAVPMVFSPWSVLQAPLLATVLAGDPAGVGA